MAMLAESSNQVAVLAEDANSVRVVERHTFLELVEEDEFVSCSGQTARCRSFSDPGRFIDHMLLLDKYEMERESAASTQASDVDDDYVEVLSDDEELPIALQAPLGVQAPPGVFAQAQARQQQDMVPVCVAFVPVMEQTYCKKPSRSARRRRARAMHRRFRHNMQSLVGEQQGSEVDYLGAEFDDELQLLSDDDESPEFDVESWPVPTSSVEVQDKIQKKKA